MRNAMMHFPTGTVKPTLHILMILPILCTLCISAVSGAMRTPAHPGIQLTLTLPVTYGNSR
jgi:hypothetical protein